MYYWFERVERRFAVLLVIVENSYISRLMHLRRMFADKPGNNGPDQWSRDGSQGA